MKRTALLLAALAALTAPGLAPATPDARLLLYRGGGEGRVTFDARLHRSKGYVCNDCHLELFATKKASLIDQAAHRGGKSCFACHDGKTAFEACEGCHRASRR